MGSAPQEAMEAETEVVGRGATVPMAAHLELQALWLRTMGLLEA